MNKNLFTFLLFMYTGVLFLSKANNNTWYGNTEDFLIKSKEEIQLNSEKAGKSYLSTFSDRFLNTCWEFNVTLLFNPSSSNYTDIYLCSDREDLTESAHAYFVRVGHTNDNISLYRKTNGRSYKIIEGIKDRLDLPSVNVDIKITCTLYGEWEIFSRLQEEDFFEYEGNTKDYQQINGQYFGWICSYTKTRNKAFIIRNIQIHALNEIHEQILKNTTSPKPSDIIFNEILFNGREYIEFYIHGNYTIDVSALSFAIRKQDGSLGKKYSLSSDPLFLETGHFLVITQNKEEVCNKYYCNEDAIFNEITNLPALNNSGSNLVLLFSDSIVIDEFIYSDKMHQEFIFNKKDIALERINPSEKTQNPDNWATASFESGYGTPGYQNSQYRNETYENIFELQKNLFHTCEEENIHLLYYQHKDRKESMNAHIYNSNGKRITKLINNAITGSSGNIYWNGKDEYGKVCKNGIYILYIEVIDLKGNIFKIKKAFTLNNC